jgi:hypothetical protein
MKTIPLFRQIHVVRDTAEKASYLEKIKGLIPEIDRAEVLTVLEFIDRRHNPFDERVKASQSANKLIRPYTVAMIDREIEALNPYGLTRRQLKRVAKVNLEAMGPEVWRLVTVERPSWIKRVYSKAREMLFK